MRYGIFSDIHGNLEALEAVVADLRGQSPDALLCLGDIAGYNADPQACLRIVRHLGATVVRGNHDQETASDAPVSYANPMAKEGILHSRRQLGTEERAWLGALPYIEKVGGFTLAHASLAAPERWPYVTAPEQAARSFAAQETPLAFFGHTHVPHLFAEAGGEVAEHVYNKVTLDPAKRYFVNVGSVGQPRDGDWRAAYAVYDDAARSLELRRVPYDIAAAQAKIRAAGLPESLALRLSQAR
jgi:diadenosine tetraphosphatase ApaH/serine/threonine PP2A family protein phosphatase